MYCPHCHQLIKNRQCPTCHKHDGREVQEDDLCFFTEQGSVWAAILDDVLMQEKVPAVRRVASGVAPLVGSAMTRWRFYAPYARLEDAKRVLQELTEPVEDGASKEEMS